MSGEGTEVVRQPLRVRESKRRRLDERLVLRFPAIAALLTRLTLRFPPRSRVRKAMVRHVLKRAMEAANRDDYVAAFAILPADYEVVTPPELVGLGFDPAYYGRAGRLRFQLAWVAQLGEFRNEPEEVIDTGDRVLLLGRMKGQGASSGAVFDSEVAYLLSIADGRIVREEDFRSHDEALAAAGLKNET